MKHYFVTYQASNKDGSISIWNDVINESPMEFIKKIEKIEKREYEGSNTYKNFVVINTCEITEEEYEKFRFEF